MAKDQRNDEEEEILVGDRVDIVAPAGQVYRTMIEDRLDNGPFLVGIPSRKGVYMSVYDDDDIYLVFYRETGRYIAHMKVIALENRGAVRYMWLLQKTIAQKNQRREAFRLPVSFNVHIYEYAEDIEKSLINNMEDFGSVATEAVNSKDLSVTGISMITKKEYGLNEKYILKMHLDLMLVEAWGIASADMEPALHLTATVRRCVPWRANKTFNTGMEFLGLSKTMSEGIARYVLDEQQRQIKRRRLL